MNGGTQAGRILVTGGTGKTGSRVARGLQEAGRAVRVGSRRVPAETAIDHVRFDWADEDTYGPALAAVDGIYLVPPVLVADPVSLMLRLLDQALESGVRRIVLLSASAIPEGAPGVGQVHSAVREHAPEWAVLRPTWFMQNFVDPDHHHAQSIRSEGVIYTATGDGRVPFVDVEDIAAVAVRALLDRESHDAAHVITGPRAMTYGEVAAAIASEAGRPVRHVSLPAPEFARRLTGAGMPGDFADILAALDETIAQGAEDRATPTVERVTGRPPRSFSAFAAAHSALWRNA